MERVRALDVLLLEPLLVLGCGDVEACVRAHTPVLDRVRVAARERDERAADGVSWEVEAGRPAHGVERGLARAFERLDERAQLASRRRPVEAADTHVDRMDLAAADERHDLVAGLLQGESALDRLR